MRLRIQTQRHGQSVHDVRPARRLAARQSHRSAHRSGLRRGARRFIGPPLPERQEDRSGTGQSQHHKPASLYEAFPAYKARRLVERFEWHYTPKHGSWLDMAKSELAVLASQCLDRRIPDKQILIQQVAAWEADRNAHHAKADWQFTTDDARIKLKHLYPTFYMTRATSRFLRLVSFAFRLPLAYILGSLKDPLRDHPRPAFRRFRQWRGCPSRGLSIHGAIIRGCDENGQTVGHINYWYRSNSSHLCLAYFVKYDTTKIGRDATKP